MTIAPAKPALVITEPGVYDAIPDRVYHADPVPAGSLSVSGAKLLLPPSCPAKFAWERAHPPLPKDTYSFGHAAHKLVLGVGPDLVVVDTDDWRTKAAKEAKTAALADGNVPLLRHEHDVVQAMAAAIRNHRLAARLLAPGTGLPEQSLFWADPDTGVWLRGRVDWLRHPRAGKRLILVDYKTCDNASDEAFARTAYDYGYHRQDPWYVDGAKALGLDDDPAFVFVLQEKTPPYLVNVVELDPVAVEIGRDQNRRAITIFRRCQETGRWPGYGDDVQSIALPAWVARRHMQGEDPR